MHYSVLIASTPQYPTGSNSPDAGRRKPPVPVTLALIFYLLSASAALAGVALLFTTAGKQALRDELAGSATSAMSVEDLVNTTRIIAVVVAVVIFLLYLLFAVKMRAGRNWARIVLTVLTVLSIISSFSGNLASARNWSTWVGIILPVLAIILMFLPQSSAYFAANKAARRA